MNATGSLHDLEQRNISKKDATSEQCPFFLVKNGGKWWISCSLPIASSLERTRWTQSSRCVDQHGLWSIEVNDMYFSGWPSFMVRSFFCGWLVVFRLPLWKMMDLVSRDDEIPNIWKKKSCSKPPTRWKDDQWCWSPSFLLHWQMQVFMTILYSYSGAGLTSLQGCPGPLEKLVYNCMSCFFW